MPSLESRQARRALTKERVNPTRTLTDDRADWDAYGASLPLARGVTPQALTIAGVPCLRLQPSKPATSAVIVYAHGGGLVSGSVLTHRAFASHLARACAMAVILPDYRLLPDHVPEAARDDLHTVLQEVGPKTSVLAGDSSGAGLGLSLMQHLRDQGQDLPAGFVSISGAFDATLSGVTHDLSEDPILSREVLEHWQTQLGEVDLAGPVLSPLLGEMAGLPPMLLIAGRDEVWLDDTRRLQKRAAPEGVRCFSKVFDGMWHVFPMATELPEAQEALNLIAVTLKGWTEA